MATGTAGFTLSTATPTYLDCPVYQLQCPTNYGNRVVNGVAATGDVYIVCVEQQYLLADSTGTPKTERTVVTSVACELSSCPYAQGTTDGCAAPSTLLSTTCP